MSKNVLVILPCDPSAGGGIANIFSRGVVKLSDKFELTAIFPSKQNFEEQRPWGTARGLRIPFTNVHGVSHISFGSRLRTVLGNDARWDVIHIHGEYTPIGWVPGRQGPNVIVSCHGLFELAAMRSHPKPEISPVHILWKWVGSMLQNTGLRIANSVIPTSFGVRNDLENLRPNIKSKLTVPIWNGCEISRAEYPDPSSNKLEVTTQREIRLIGFGGDWYRKGLDRAFEVRTMLETIMRVPARLLVVGRGGRRALNKGVQYLGHVAASRISALFSSADAVLVPSRYEGHPLAGLEALGSGAVIATCRSANLEPAIHEKHVICLDVWNSEAAAVRLAKIFENRKNNIEMRDRAMLLGKSLNWRVHSEQMLAHYNRNA